MSVILLQDPALKGVGVIIDRDPAKAPKVDLPAGLIVVSAEGGGIGGGLARRFAAEGAHVVLGDIALEAAETEVAAIKSAGGSAIAVHFDGADEASIATGVALAARTFGGIDGLHCNFASFADGGGDRGVLELPMADFDETLHVNLRGYVLCTRANCISPGSTMHDRLEAGLDPAMKQWCLDLAIIKSRLGRPEDIAAMAALLMSDEGSYITGQTISVDGGVTMRM